MIDIVVKFENGEFKLYEPTTDTLLITSSLGESFSRLDEFLRQRGLIATNILSTADVNYHIDSPTFIAMVKSNSDLLKRLNTSPSGFTISSAKFGISPSQNNNNNNQSLYNKNNNTRKGKRKTATFSKSSFTNSAKKFGNNY